MSWRFVVVLAVGVGIFGAEADVVFVVGAGGFGMFGAEFCVGEVEVFGGPEKFEVVMHIGQGASGAEVFEDAGLDGGADGAEEGVGVLLVADVGGGGDLGEDGAFVGLV